MATSTLGQPSYEDFDPDYDWALVEGVDTLNIGLPWFRKEQLKVQLFKDGKLHISGERLLDGNRWHRFHREFRIPDNCNTEDIRAKFEKETLSIIFPKLITQAEPTAPPPTKAPETQAMPEPSKPEADTGKQANGKSGTEKSVDSGKVEREVKEGNEEMELGAGDRSEQETGEYGVGGVLIGLTMKRRQSLVNAVVAVILLVVVGIYVTYKFRKVAAAGTRDQLDFEL